MLSKLFHRSFFNRKVVPVHSQQISVQSFNGFELNYGLSQTLRTPLNELEHQLQMRQL